MKTLLPQFTVILMLLFLTSLSSLFSQTVKQPEEALPAQQPVPLPIFYVHAGGGVALSWLSSSDIEGLFEEDFKIGSFGAPFSWCIKTGILNIVQFEYRRGDGAHSIRQPGFVPGGGVGGTGIGTVAEVKMDYDYEDTLVKFNPFFWKKTRNRKGVNIAYYLVYGKGKVDYNDKAEDGFSGDSNILGIETSFMGKYTTFSIAVKNYSISFDKGVVFDIPFDTDLKANQVQIEMSLSVGLGI